MPMNICTSNSVHRIVLVTFALLFGFAFAGAAKQEVADIGLETNGDAWQFYRTSPSDPALPRVLLIGDSIVNGYRGTVCQALAGRASVDTWLTPLHLKSAKLHEDLKRVLAQESYAVIHFNIGLHGWNPGRIPEAEYEPLLRAFVDIFQRQGGTAKLIWGSTTQITVREQPEKRDPEHNPTIVKRNTIAARVMKDRDVQVNDLYALMDDKLALAQGDKYHWKTEARHLQGKQVAAYIRNALAATSAEAETLSVCADGRTEYVILLSDDAIPSEITAAQELQAHLAQVTGVKLAIKNTDMTPPHTKAIVVGPNHLLRAAFPDFDPATLGQDGIVMKTQGDTIFLAGDRPRGTLYAVYTFLEEVVGCRWWTATEHSIPRRPVLEIPALDVVYAPKLRSRGVFYRGAFDGVFSARLKANGHHHRVPPAYGSHYTILGWCHTFDRLLPPETYFESHPEWYSEINGKRVEKHSQLCLTNTAMRKELVKNALAWIREAPEAGIISISQNDWNGRCQCAACLALEEREGGVPSGPLIHFVNAVAEEIEKEFPEVLVETLAYRYTRQAPKLVKPRHNVVVRLCSIECSYAQPLTDPTNETFKKDIEAWSAIAHQLYIWDYVTNFSNYILPHPNMRVLAPNLRFFVDHKTIGLFEQGDSGSSCSDFPELRAWLLAHLMWDPQRDEEALIDTFLAGYYGPAATALRDYIDLIHDAVEKSEAPLRCYMSDTSTWLSLDNANRATALFNEAEKAVQGDVVRTQRVQRARMPLDHVWLNRYNALRRQAKGEGMAFAGPDDPALFAVDFIKRAHRFNVGSYREGRPFTEYESRLLHRFREAGTLPARCVDLDPNDWIDIQDNEFRLSNYGKWASIVDDPKASDGKAARMPSNHTQWAVQYPVSADVTTLGPVRCYVVARCMAKTGEVQAFELGIWDSETNTNVARKTVPINLTAGKAYQEYDLGVHELTSTMYLWVAPMNNPEHVEAVLVDRIYYVQETP